jgi:hypothetical protein
MIGHPKLKGWWRFDSTYADSSGAGLTGTLEGTGSIVAGMFGKSYTSANTLDGINLLHQTSLDFTVGTPFSICCWVKPVNFTRYLTIFAKVGDSTSYKGYWLAVDITTGKIHFNITNHATTAIRWVISTPSIPTGSYSHICVTYDGTDTTATSSLSIYINGIKVATTVYNTTNNTSVSGGFNNPYSVYIGNRYTPSTNLQGFNGNIDDVQVYSMKLIESDIKRIMNGGHPLNRS